MHVDAGQSQYLDTTVTPGVSYRYIVYAVGEDGSEIASAPVEAIAYVPGPTNLTIASSTDTSVTLDWTNNFITASGYELLISDGFDDPQVIPLPADASTYEVDGLVKNRTYQFEVQACDASGMIASDPSNTVEFATPLGPDTFYADGISTSQSILSWSDDSNGTQA